MPCPDLPDECRGAAGAPSDRSASRAETTTETRPRAGDEGGGREDRLPPVRPRPSKLAAAAFGLAEGAWLLLLAILPAAVNPYGALAVEPLKTSLVRCLALIVGAGWVAGRLLGGHAAPPVGMPPIVRAGLALVAATALSTLLSLNPGVSFFGSYVRGMGLLSTAGGALLLVSGAELLRDARRRERLLTALLLSSVFPCGYAWLQWLGLDPLTWSGVTGLVSSLGSPTSLGGYLVLVMPLTAYRVLAYGRAVAAGAGLPTSGGYALHLALLLVQGLALVQASIRGPLLGFAFGAMVFGVLIIRAIPRSRRPGACAALAALVLAVLALALVAGGRGLSFAQRFLAAADPGGSGAERLVVWQAAAPLPLRDPLRALVGFGPEMQPAAFEQAEPVARLPGNVLWDRAHSLLLDTWLTGGLLGLMALVLVVAVAWRSVWAVLSTAERPSSVLAAAILAALSAHLVEAMFAFQTVVTGALFWTLLAMGAGLTRAPAGNAMPGPRALNGLAAATATCAAILVLPLLAAPAIADHLHGLAQRQATAQAAARLAEQASVWAPWVEELPRYAGIRWQEAGFGRTDPLGAAALSRAALALEEAARRAPLDPSAHLRVARHYLAWSGQAAPPEETSGRRQQAEWACERALATGPFRLSIWETCAEVSEAAGAHDQASARKERARQLRPT